MKNLILSFGLYVLLSALIAGCASTSESIAPIQKNDLDEADFIREVLLNNPDSKGNYEVIPGSQATTVKIINPRAPLDERALRLSMKKIKDSMRGTFHREPNKLRFVFQEVTIEE